MDAWEFRELQALPLTWFVGIAVILRKVKDIGVWPDVLLDASVAMFPASS